MRLSSAVPSGAAVLLLLGLIGLSARPARAQTTATPSAPDSARAALLARLHALQASAVDPGVADSVRASARVRATRLRNRLADGDFSVGDAVRLTVWGDSTLSGTYVVGPGSTIELGVLGPVSLHGVLYSELQPYLTAELRHYLRDPVVRAEPLVRVSVIGEVQTPGFYAVSPMAAVADALMAAGGPTRSAKVAQIVVVRAGNVVWRAGPSESLQVGGVLQSGDVIRVPAASGGNLGQVVQYTAIAIPAIISLITLLTRH